MDKLGPEFPSRSLQPSPILTRTPQIMRGSGESPSLQLVSLRDFNEDSPRFAFNPVASRGLVAHQSDLALRLTGKAQADPRRRPLPSLQEYLALRQPAQELQHPLFVLSDRPSLTRDPWGLSRDTGGLNLAGRNPILLLPRDNPSRLLGTDRLQLPRRDTPTFGHQGPLGSFLPVQLEDGRNFRVRRPTRAVLGHLTGHEGARSLAVTTEAVAAGGEPALDQARRLALGDARTLAEFGRDAEDAFGERLQPVQIQRGALEALAQQPEPGQLDYQLFEGAVLSAENPGKEFPMASLALSRGVAFDHGGARDTMREAMQSPDLPLDSRRRAAAVMSQAAYTFKPEDIQALENTAILDPDLGLRMAAAASLMNGPLKVDRSLERIHATDLSRKDGGSDALRGQIEVRRLQLMEEARGEEKERIAHSLLERGNQDRTRVAAFGQATARSQQESRASELSREFSDAKARNELLGKYAPNRFSAENDRLVSQLTVPGTGALQLLSQSPRESLSESTFARVKQEVKAHGDEASRRAILEKMPEGPITSATLEKAGRAAQESIGEAIAKAEDGDLARLARLYQAKNLLEGDFRDKARPDALKTVNQEIGSLQNSESVQKKFQEIAQQARREASGGRDLAKEQAEYLSSDAFLDRLEVAGPQLGDTMLKAEVMKLQSLDPDKAGAAAENLARRLTERQGQANWNQMDDSGREAVVRESLLTVQKDLQQEGGSPDLQSALGVGANSGKVVKTLSSTLNEVAKEAHGNLTAPELALKKLSLQSSVLERAMKSGNQDEIAKLTSRYGDLDTLKKSVNLLKSLDAHGKIGTFGAAISVTSLVTGGLHFDDVQSGASTLGTLAAAAGGVDDVLKMTGWLTSKVSTRAGGALGRAGTALGAVRAMKFLGPLGDTLGAVSDGAKMVDQIQSGDAGAAFVSGLTTLGYSGAAAAGLYAICAASGPVGWVALGLSVTAWGIGSLFGESSEEALLRREVQGADGRPLRLMD